MAKKLLKRKDEDGEDWPGPSIRKSISRVKKAAKKKAAKKAAKKKAAKKAAKKKAAKKAAKKRA